MSELEAKGYGDREKATANPFWTYLRLEDKYKWICCRLARSGGPLGWSDSSIKAAHIKKADIDVMVRAGLVVKKPLWEFAEALLEIERMGDIYSGTDPDLSDPEERKKWLLCEYARDIVANKTQPENSNTHYQVADEDLYEFIQILNEN